MKSNKDCALSVGSPSPYVATQRTSKAFSISKQTLGWTVEWTVKWTCCCGWWRWIKITCYLRKIFNIDLFWVHDKRLLSIAMQIFCQASSQFLCSTRLWSEQNQHLTTFWFHTSQERAVCFLRRNYTAICCIRWGFLVAVDSVIGEYIASYYNNYSQYNYVHGVNISIEPLHLVCAPGFPAEKEREVCSYNRQIESRTRLLQDYLILGTRSRN